MSPMMFSNILMLLPIAIAGLDPEARGGRRVVNLRAATPRRAADLVGKGRTRRLPIVAGLSSAAMLLQGTSLSCHVQS